MSVEHLDARESNRWPPHDEHAGRRSELAHVWCSRREADPCRHEELVGGALNCRQKEEIVGRCRPDVAAVSHTSRMTEIACAIIRICRIEDVRCAAPVSLLPALEFPSLRVITLIDVRLSIQRPDARLC